jgi:hypothetical protein
MAPALESSITIKIPYFWNWEPFPLSRGFVPIQGPNISGNIDAEDALVHLAGWNFAVHEDGKENGTMNVIDVQNPDFFHAGKRPTALYDRNYVIFKQRTFAMTRHQYFVVHHQGQWKVKYGSKYEGVWESQNLAIKAAIDLAHNVGGDSQVLVQGEDNKFREEWTYGHDPYPPKG